MKKCIIGMLFTCTCLCWLACNKLIDINPPKTQVTTTDIFSDSSLLNATALNIYSTLNNYERSFSINNGLYVDDLFSTANFNMIPNYVNCALSGNDGNNNNTAWITFYSVIYQANAILEGLEQKTLISHSFIERITGEAKFLRAYAYFYLINIWGNVPLLTTSNVKINANALRAPVADVYLMIVDDLKNAQSLLKSSYPAEEKVRATMMAASALLARVYLYQNDYRNAEAEATIVIGSNNYTLPTPSEVFIENSQEAILQIWNQSGYTALSSLLPVSPTVVPVYTITNNLLETFEAGDQRRLNWIDSNVLGVAVYYFPFKYKQNQLQTGPQAEYIVLLRLGEQYLIRAEARAQQNNITGAISDINLLRTRAGLSALPDTLSQANVLEVIYRERRIELFCEEGQRFFDLKRTSQINIVLGTLKPGWQTTAALYPIPNSEISTDPNLTQNPGYN